MGWRQGEQRGRGGIALGADLNDVRSPIDRTLRPLGFRSRGERLWDRETEKVFQVVHLYKSSFDVENLNIAKEGNWINSFE